MKNKIIFSKGMKNLFETKRFLVIMFIIIGGLFCQVLYFISQVDLENTNNSNLINSAAHLPISIDGNTALDTFCSSAGTDGQSWATAHVIENYEIIAEIAPPPSGIGSCIEIINTDRYLMIKDCNLQNSVGMTSAGGIYLQECQNINITGCEFYDNDAGIVLWNSNNIDISSNNFFECGTGIRLQNSESNVISNNFISYNTANGINLIRSDYNTISENEVSFNKFIGIKLSESKRNVITYNNVSYNSLNGINLGSDTEYNKIFDNIIINNEDEGIVDLGTNNEIYNNEQGSPTISSYPFLWMFGLISTGFIILYRKTLKNLRSSRN